MSELDSMDKIAEDLISLCEAYQNRERPPISGIVQVLDDAFAHRKFLIGFVSIIARVKDVPQG